MVVIELILLRDGGIFPLKLLPDIFK
uniref:Uncharacterized protein n=1 Tax=Rhizophora mucronata TaxID=61149 RepID=A0A2P2MWS3_RHIMU